MTESIDRAQRRLDRAERYVQIGKVVFAFYVVLVTVILLIQQIQVQQNQATQIKQAQDGLAKSLLDNADQQHKTQDYIRCIASALVVPLTQRDDKIFDKCGIDTTTGQQTVGSSSPTALSTPATPPPSSATPAPVSQQPTTSSPPDPNRSTNARPAGLINTILQIPIIGPVLKQI